MHSTIVHHSGSQRQFSARAVVAMKIIWNKFVSTKAGPGKKDFCGTPQPERTEFLLPPFVSVEKKHPRQLTGE